MGLRARVNTGRFFWAFNETGQPLVRLAVADPDPGGRPVSIGATVVARLDRDELERPGFAFPREAFRAASPAVRSDLFVTVACADLWPGEACHAIS